MLIDSIVLVLNMREVAEFPKFMDWENFISFMTTSLLVAE